LQPLLLALTPDCHRGRITIVRKLFNRPKFLSEPEESNILDIDFNFLVLFNREPITVNRERLP